MSDTTLVAVASAASALGTGLFAFLMALLNRPKTKAEAKKIEVEAQKEKVDLLDRMQNLFEEQMKNTLEFGKTLNMQAEALHENELVIKEQSVTIEQQRLMMLNLQTELKKKDGEILALTNRITELENALREQGEAKDLAITGLEAEIATLRGELEVVKNDRARLEAEMAQLKGESDDTVPLPSPEAVQAELAKLQVEAGAATSPTTTTPQGAA